MDDTRRERVCWNFLNGYCRYGSRCIFRHIHTFQPLDQICWYFQKGSCWYGDHCRYKHALLPEADAARRCSVPTVSSSSVAPLPLRRGSEPSFVQTEESERRDSNSETRCNNPFTEHACRIPPANIKMQQAQDVDSKSNQSLALTPPGPSAVQNEESSSEILEDDAAAYGETGATAAAATFETKSENEVQQAFLLTKTIICGICMEVVYEKLDAKSRVFGILPNCNHTYCLHCIKTWRKSKDFGPDVVKTCPQCRVSSPFYVPNQYWVEGSAKEKLIAAFKDKFGKKPCSFYARSGLCPFKTDCLYRHDPSRRPMLYFMKNDDEDDHNLDYLDVDLLGFFIAMAFLDADDNAELDTPE